MYALYDTKSDKEWPTFFTDEEELASDIEEVISRSKAMFGSNYVPNLVLVHCPKVRHKTTYHIFLLSRNI